MAAPRAVFGMPSVWDSTFQSHEAAFRSIELLRSVTDDLVTFTKDDQRDQVRVANALADVSSSAMLDVILLVGNRRGVGAMRIARGIFEIGVLASYLAKNPKDVSDYVDFGVVEGWRHLQTLEKHMPGSVSPELIKQAEGEYNRIKPRFSNPQGRVQNRWTTKSVRQISEEVGRLNIYEIAYSAASELHHVPLIGVIGHELDWSKEALFIAYGSLLDAVVALREASDYKEKDFCDRLNKAIADFDLLRK